MSNHRRDLSLDVINNYERKFGRLHLARNLRLMNRDFLNFLEFYVRLIVGSQENICFVTEDNHSKERNAIFFEKGKSYFSGGAHDQQ
jgi:hypothetical protein